jgi:hypothetical protein
LVTQSTLDALAVTLGVVGAASITLIISRFLADILRRAF